jgi:hypothetical protein
MTTVTRRISTAVRSLWQDLGRRRFEASPPPAVGPSERAIRGTPDDHCGRSESVDPDNVGDIADEGRGHRG